MWTSNIIFRKWGIPEYCQDYGVPYKNLELQFEEKLNEII